MRLRLAPARALVAVCLLSGAGVEAQGPSKASSEFFQYGAEWRFTRAGEIELRWSGDTQGDMGLRTVGLVGRLYRVQNAYRARYEAGFCALDTLLDAHEGRRHRETKVTYDREKRRVLLLERDVIKDAVVDTKELEIPACVHEVTGALRKLRELRPEPGTTIHLPMSDGKKVISARVDALAREKVQTPLGEFASIKYEAHLFDGVLYRRKGRLFVWLTDDDKRLPVQIRVQLPFYIGTVTIQMEKMERE